MAGETNLEVLLQHMEPVLNEGEFVFCTANTRHEIASKDIIGSFQEQEGTTLILEKGKADTYGLAYEYIAAWITLNIHSALDAIGLTAAFSNALAAAGISCNVVAGYYHDHIFVAKTDAQLAIEVLKKLSLDADGAQST